MRVHPHYTYEYFSYLLSQLKEYPRNNVPEDVLADLMPWSDAFKAYVTKEKAELIQKYRLNASDEPPGNFG